jgi:hypothetical protein
MESAFHYLVKIKLYNYHNKDNVEFIEKNQEFKNESPIIARQEAFRFYQNWLDVLLTGIDSEYIDDMQARDKLKSYLKPSEELKLRFDDEEIVLSNAQSIGIGIYHVIDIPTAPIWKDDTLNDHVGDTNLIHGIGNSGEYNDPPNCAYMLENEFEYYINNDYDYLQFKTEAQCFDWRNQEVIEFSFLKTPFDWEGLENPSNPRLGLILSKDYEHIIAQGEGDSVEFKPTLSYNFKYKTWQGKYNVNYIIAKAICSFLNTTGGLLFIGVKDNGEPQGLDFDFRLSDKENDVDFFKLEFDKVLEAFFGFSIRPFISSEFFKLEGKLIFVADISPSLNKPIFLSTNDGAKEFWVRGNASNRQLRDFEEIFNYWQNRELTLNRRKS